MVIFPFFYDKEPKPSQTAAGTRAVVMAGLDRSAVRPCARHDQTLLTRETCGIIVYGLGRPCVRGLLAKPRSLPVGLVVGQSGLILKLFWFQNKRHAYARPTYQATLGCRQQKRADSGLVGEGGGGAGGRRDGVGVD